MRALLAGRFGEVEPLSREAAQLGKRVQDPNASQAHVLQLIALRREQGRLEEMREPVEEHVARFGAIPGWRCVQAYVHAELGDDDRARAELDAFGEGDFAALPLDGLWLGGIALLAEAAATTRDVRHAEALYQRLLPYANRNVAIGWASVCVGSASRHLGLLAGLLGRRHAAAGHFEDALALNTRMSAEPWVARTELGYGELLLDAGDDARGRALLARARDRGAALGMVGLVADAERLSRGASRRRAPVVSG
jgi:tetratricopeptide (TPR) repeat protein